MSDSPIILNGVVLPFPTKAPPRKTWARRVIDALASPVTWLRRQSDIRKLQALDDHLLEDIGIARSEISRAVRHGRD